MRYELRTQIRKMMSLILAVAMLTGTNAAWGVENVYAYETYDNPEEAGNVEGDGESAQEAYTGEQISDETADEEVNLEETADGETVDGAAAGDVVDSEEVRTQKVNGDEAVSDALSDVGTADSITINDEYLVAYLDMRYRSEGSSTGNTLGMTIEYDSDTGKAYGVISAEDVSGITGLSFYK